MKVLMTADTVGGVWTYALELARALPEVEFVFATMGAPATEAQRREARALENVGLVESEYRLEWMDDFWRDVARAGDWLLELEAHLQPDLIHLNGYAHGALPWQAPCLIVAHSCVLSWWWAVKGEAAPHAWKRYREAVAGGLSAADAIVAPSRAMLDALTANYGVSRGEVIFNARDACAFQPRQKQPFIFTAGRLWDEAKNIAALDAIAGELSWPVLAAGDFGARGSDALHALGRLTTEEMAHHLASTAIYALLARYEPFGLGVLEAALSGCALVLGDIPSLRELWEGAALFVRPDDHAGLRTRLQHLIDQPVEREQWAQRASARARSFSSERMAKAYRALYARLQNAAASREVAA